ncbi:hypothetical protein SAMN05421504_106391 [Amycolatopsis xylanica]|uniref:Transcriptional regulator, AbiEi antitoxin, Type IV TA system n=1 Tax=Amycolatopsis xylanica TaxID=589385 RepID=A0A1H3LWR5_9PSEU|nr:hypothetical protein [Amycolatopsis xylanica]SDY68806.1 hypothetical protein SAMN05421504_106391 [Amycolatopsis xylanica]
MVTMVGMTNRGRWEGHPELLRERSRLGVVRAADLEEAGIHSSTIYDRCLPGGPWQILLPGIILRHNGKPTQDQRATGALLYTGPDAMLTGVEACRRHGLSPDELPDDMGIHVLNPHEIKVRSVDYLTVERTRRAPTPIVRNKLLLSPLVRATTDAVRGLRSVDPIQKLLIEAIQRGRCAPEALLAELDIGTTRGTAIPRRLLKEWANIRSIAEARAKALSHRLPVPPSHWNVPLHSQAGHYVGCPDAWWDDIGLAWEIDSFEFHFYREGYARTLTRNNRYAAAGITVVQTVPSRLGTDPAGVLAELKAAYAVAASRVRPDVRLGAA